MSKLFKYIWTINGVMKGAYQEEDIIKNLWKKTMNGE